MSMRMLIDAAHAEETRVVVVKGKKLDSFEFESAAKSQLKGNIYLAKVTRVEPSLQAAFVEYGGNRHGFLAFSEIHPDYYQIPVADRQALVKEQAAADKKAAADSDDTENGKNPEVESLGAEAEMEEVTSTRAAYVRPYKIQEVIKRRQVILVQVVKEERGNKGAALTTYISLAGRYCVLMPNTARGGGISRKIVNAKDRKRLKAIAGEFKVPEGMGVIVRTAGMNRTKREIKRDYKYLLRLWDDIREVTLKSTAPCIVHEEGNLIKRSIRDLYSKDIGEVLVEGDEGYRVAKDFMRALMPSQAKTVQPFKDKQPLFHKYEVEEQLAAMYSPRVDLPSGGYIVINVTEALVAIDVNSGRATKERNIEETAYRTNLEAAEEAARQLRLRDMAGLIVIDLNDMENNKNNRSVEGKMKECLKADRARITVGRISSFGLMEMSRQRLRPGLLEASTDACQTCGGTGVVRSVESLALTTLRSIEQQGIRTPDCKLKVSASPGAAMYILNEKRNVLRGIEERHNISVFVEGDTALSMNEHRLVRIKDDGDETVVETVETPAPRAKAEPKQRAQRAPRSEDKDDEAGQGEGRRRRRRRRRRGKRGDFRRDEGATKQADAVEDAPETTTKPDEKTDAEDGSKEEKTAKRKTPTRRRRAKTTKPVDDAKTGAAESVVKSGSDVKLAEDGEKPAKVKAKTRTRKRPAPARKAKAEKPAKEKEANKTPAKAKKETKAKVEKTVAKTEKPAAAEAKESTKTPDAPAAKAKSEEPKRRGWWQRRSAE